MESAKANAISPLPNSRKAVELGAKDHLRHRHDLVGDLDLTAHGIDADQGALQLLGSRELVEQLRDGGDLVGLLRH